MRLTLVDRNSDMCLAWRAEFGGVAGVNIHRGDIFGPDAPELEAIVSPANSFGFMDGGIDAAYTAHFGPGVQARVQSEIKARPFGELLVGEAIAVPTGHPHTRFMIVAPTMRTPRLITNPVDVYLSTRAALALAAYWGWEGVLVPGMGTGCGNVPAQVAAHQMRLAYNDVLKPLAFPPSWFEARQREMR